MLVCSISSICTDLRVNQDLSVIPLEHLAIIFMQVKPLTCLFNDLFVYMENQLARPLWFPYLFPSRIRARRGTDTACSWHPPSPAVRRGLLWCGDVPSQCIRAGWELGRETSGPLNLLLKANINKYQPRVSMRKVMLMKRETSLFYSNNWWLKKAWFQPVLCEQLQLCFIFFPIC